MNIINQPFNGQLGDIIIEKLGEHYNKLTILSAFAKNSGVLRLKPALQEFKSNGGYIEAFIGLDAYGTSYEALLNLFEICDALYVVHSESVSTTFHSKVYALSNNENDMWVAIGSNNLTGGGLWSNFETAICFDATETDENMVELNSVVQQYKDPEYECSKLIESEAALEELLELNYLRREIRIQIENRIARRNETEGEEHTPRIFGIQTGIRLPRVQREPAGAMIQVGRAGEQVRAINPIQETNATERMWFETRALTGGSRNILDLSKLGTVIEGNSAGTRYETDDENMILGGVAFFDIEPESVETEKDIVVNYNGTDYSWCTIKFATNNGSWRIQLKGSATTGEKIHLVEGKDWLRYKIIVFEKIRTDYYVMSVLDSDQLHVLKAQSRVVATNGSADGSKQYGLL